MTKSRYYLYLLFKAFGAKIAQRRLADATHELHLMKDAQELLGFYNADHIEHIDELKTEYWEIKHLKSQIHDLEEEEENVTHDLQDAMSRRGELSQLGLEEKEQLEEEIAELVEKREDALEKRTEIFNEGKRIRKVYDGLKAKMDYFINDLDEEDPERIETSLRLEECMTNLTLLKGERDYIISTIAELETQINDKDNRLRKIEEEVEFQTFTNSTDLGGRNKQLTELRSKRALLQNTLDKNIRYVGRFLFANRKDREVNACIKSHRELIHQANALRKSVILNHKLVDSRVEMVADD